MSNIKNTHTGRGVVYAGPERRKRPNVLVVEAGTNNTLLADALAADDVIFEDPTIINKLHDATNSLGDAIVRLHESTQELVRQQQCLAKAPTELRAAIEKSNLDIVRALL